MPRAFVSEPPPTFRPPRSARAAALGALGRSGLLVAILLASVSWAQSVRIVLRWKEVPGAKAYELQISKDSGFSEVVLQTRTPTPSYRWERLPTQTHWWRVRTVDADGRPSEWSAPLALSVDSTVPEILRPLEGAKVACGGSFEAELAPSLLVKEYLLELSSTADFGSPTVLRQATFVFNLGSLGAGSWYLRASAVDRGGRKTGPGPVRAFSVRLSAPRLRPAPDAWLGATQVALTWGEVACATRYLVEALDETKERTSMPAVEPRLTFKPTAAADYRWRVAGVDSAGTPGEWSPEAWFKVKLPTPQPKGERVLLDAELTWAPVPTAASYRVEVTPDEGAPLEAVTAQTQWRSPELAVGHYRWRVQAKDAKGHSSLFSAPRAFERPPVTALPTPLFLSQPLDHEVGAPLEVSWGPVAGASDYQVELDGDVLPVQRGTSTMTPPLAQGWHRVRVRALTPPLKASPFSAALEVFSGVPPVASAKVESQGAVVHVDVVDRLGRLVRKATPSFAVKRGALEQVAQEHDGRWALRWRPPPSGDDVLQIDSQDFHVESPLSHRRSPAWLSASVGLIANGGAVLSYWGVVGVGTRLPVLEERLGLELRAGVYSASATAVLREESYRAWAYLVPASFLVSWLEQWGAWGFRGAVGPSLQVALVGVGDARQTRVLPGVEVAASVSRRLGPGRLELELGFLYARLDSTLAKLNAGGAGARVGYVLEL